MFDPNDEQLGELLSAYSDGELDAGQIELVEGILRNDADARALLEELRNTVTSVSSLPRHAAPDSIAQDVQHRVERAELLGDFEASTVSDVGRRSPLLALTSLAAALCVMVVGWWVVTVGMAPEEGRPADQVAMSDAEKREESPTELEGLRAGGESKKERATDARRVRRGGEEKGARAVEESERTVDDQSHESPADANDGRALSPAELIATASFEQKLSAGMDATVVRHHAFENESVRLRVNVPTKAGGDAVQARLAAFLRQRHAINLDDVAPGEADEPVETGSFYYQGRAGTNFAEGGGRQTLVYASRQELDQMMEELVHATVAEDSVTLLAGPVAIEGLSPSREALRGMGETRRSFDQYADASMRDDTILARAGTPDEARRTMGERSSFTGGGAIDEILAVVGLEPGLEILGDEESAESGQPERGDLEYATPMQAKEVGDGRPASPSAAGAVTANTGMSTRQEPAKRDTATPVETAGEADLGDADGRRWEGDKGIAKTKVHEKRQAEALERRRSLVEQRIEALEGSPNRIGEEAVASTTQGRVPPQTQGSGAGRGAFVPASPEAQSVEAYITLVVQIVVAEPEARPPTTRPNSKSETRTKAKGTSSEDVE